MKTNEIYLEFEDKTVPSLAGYDYGEKIYDDQVKYEIDFTADEIVIIFPDDKTVVASSFVEGFFNEIKEKIGVKGIKEKVKIKSNSEKIKNKIKDTFK